MSKRYFPQQQGERKKAKLNISVSDHNFPLSQNNELNKVSNNDDNWGDDNDDEILMLASQACEEAYSSNDISILPDYSMCMQPGSTSTQKGSTSSQIRFQPSPSTSKTEFTFKKPSFNSPSAISTHLKEKCNRISSPLPGISSKMIPNTNGQLSANLSDDLIFNDKVCKGQDIDQMYRKLLQMQEECEKLKSVNGKLMEKCVTKEGEASILRTQLKTCQTSVDNARLEKIKALEKVQVECTEKLTAANKQMHDLRTQLDFKNLEIISVKEKCRKLESSKVKLTQVMVTGNDISQRHLNLTQNESITTQSKRSKTLSTSVQTENQAHLLQLHKTCDQETKTQPTILSYILEPSESQNHSILDYNDKLQKTTDYSQNKCRIYSTFHRVPSTPVPKVTGKPKVVISSVYEDVTCVLVGNCEGIERRYFNIFDSIKLVLNETRSRLEAVCQRVTTSFQKEMDEKYLEVTSNYQVVSTEDLMRGRALYKEEQEITCRRLVAMLSYILDSSSGMQWFGKHELVPDEDSEGTEGPGLFVDTVLRICVLIDNASCATLYSGLLLSITTLIPKLMSKDTSKVLDIIKTILTSRPMPFVVTHVLDLVKTVSGYEDFLTTFCPGNGTGNLKTDYDQGVLLYKKDSCFIQVLLKQTEACLKCIEKQDLKHKAVETTQSLIILYTNINDSSVGSSTCEKTRCDCQLVLVQVIVYALRICAVMLDGCKSNASSTISQQLLSACRCGIQVLYQCAARDVEFGAQLAHNEGHLIDFCERLRGHTHGDACTNMLTELAGTLQSSPEDMPPLYHRQPWLKSFEAFSMTD
ncbi:unnamed protein product [Chrysodeixis includens]|uniref:Uncharacterized protein n=1 Tax=Chrysodeixis includens TaxID=689277 RepID=A0A9P0BRJ9_CHRIL|nr:unnamed protein product [Chrysodeixis includens]